MKKEDDVDDTDAVVVAVALLQDVAVPLDDTNAVALALALLERLETAVALGDPDKLSPAVTRALVEVDAEIVREGEEVKDACALSEN